MASKARDPWGDLIGSLSQPYGPWARLVPSAVSLWRRGRPCLERLWLRGANVHDHPSCWRRSLEVPLWPNGHSPPRRNPNTCVWTKGMTILQAVGLPPDTAIGSTSDASGDGEAHDASEPTSGIRGSLPGGLWNGRWHGSSKCRAGPGPVRQEGSRTTSDVLQLACALLWFRLQWRTGHFEIVTKALTFNTDT